VRVAQEVGWSLPPVLDTASRQSRPAGRDCASACCGRPLQAGGQVQRPGAKRPLRRSAGLPSAVAVVELPVFRLSSGRPRRMRGRSQTLALAWSAPVHPGAAGRQARPGVLPDGRHQLVCGWGKTPGRVWSHGNFHAPASTTRDDCALKTVSATPAWGGLPGSVLPPRAAVQGAW